MQATTIKLDAHLHAAIRKLKSREQSLTGYVRELVAREEKRTALESAAGAYAELLAKYPEEAAEMAAWEDAPLVRPLKRTRK
jgi:vacuolar-type H+-ATPase subunit H